MKNKKYIIVDSRRFFGFITILLLISLLFMYLIFFTDKVYSDNNYKEIYKENYIEYYVKSGDSLWNILIEYLPEDYDIREVVYNVKKINDMKTSLIYEGDIIKIPLYD